MKAIGVRRNLAKFRLQCVACSGEFLFRLHLGSPLSVYKTPTRHQRPPPTSVKQLSEPPSKPIGMASDSDPKRSPSAGDGEENPFIIFRRFADAQISALLQSFVGLPSAFTPPASGTNARWLVFEEDFRRREEQLARSSTDTATGMSTGQTDDDAQTPNQR